MKRALVLGGGGFIGGHLAHRLKKEGFWVRVVDIKPEHEFWNHDDICDEYISGDLRSPLALVGTYWYDPVDFRNKLKMKLEEFRRRNLEENIAEHLGALGCMTYVTHYFFSKNAFGDII